MQRNFQNGQTGCMSTSACFGAEAGFSCPSQSKEYKRSAGAVMIFGDAIFLASFFVCLVGILVSILSLIGLRGDLMVYVLLAVLPVLVIIIRENSIWKPTKIGWLQE